jgi:hypothetical protein
MRPLKEKMMKILKNTIRKLEMLPEKLSTRGTLK